MSRVLQLSILLVGLCQAHCTTSPSGLSQEAGEALVSQLRMLSLGLAHLLQGVEENTKQLEQQGEKVAAELDRTMKTLENHHKQNLQARRTHRQVMYFSMQFRLTSELWPTGPLYFLQLFEIN